MEVEMSDIGKSKRKESLQREPILDIVKKSGRTIQNSEMKDDKEFMMEAIDINPLCFQFGTKELRGDKEVVLAAVRKNGHMIWYATVAMKSDKEVVMTAVTSTPGAYLSISDELKADKDVILTVVSQNGEYLRHVPLESRTRDVVIFAMQNSTWAYEFIPEGLRDDPIVQDMIRQIKTRIEAKTRGGARTRGKRKGTRRSKKRKGTIQPTHFSLTFFSDPQSARKGTQKVVLRRRRRKGGTGGKTMAKSRRQQEAN